MALITKKPKGTEDVLPKDSYRWQFVENIFREEARAFGYKEIRTPVFEHTNLFERGVGSTTDVVQKEMYTFITKGNDSITLRPEGTAGAARAVLEHGVFNDPLPIKAYYLVSCYRYERPQSGRQREFHQFGMECYGSDSPAADAEMITAAKSIFDRLQLRNIRLEINSIGCPACRREYHKALKEYFSQYRDELCEDCKDRLERNPMRLLDCKVPHDHELAKNAPVGLDYLCDECRDHFEKVKAYLDINDVAYTVNPKIVRGLDYYTKTVFEFICDDIGAQSTVCGGGRYDGLMEELGGNPMPGLGFGMGIERLLLTLDKQGVDIPQPESCDVFIASIGEEAGKKASALAIALRRAGLYAEFDVVGRGLKAQMKYANKIGAKFSLVLGDNELEENKANIKNMQSGEQTEISLSPDEFLDSFMGLKLTNDFKEG
ncbi:MAG: histidine--tRNA ligase [Ruminococcus sp.]|nr:histidine--tRNA ligase [Ruminococcus sp.]